MGEEERPAKEGIEEADVDVEGIEAAATGSALGNEPPERKEGHSERSSGSEAGCFPMKDRIAAAYEKVFFSEMAKERRKKVF